MHRLSKRGMCHIHPLKGMAYDSSKLDFGLIPYGLPNSQSVDRFDEEGKEKIAEKLQNWRIITDVVEICKFYIYNGLGPGNLARLVSTLTGWDIEAEELFTIGENVYSLQRIFNVREDIKKNDDMPSRQST